MAFLTPDLCFCVRMCSWTTPNQRSWCWSSDVILQGQVCQGSSTIRRERCLCVTMHRVISVWKNLHINSGQMFNYTGCRWNETQRPHVTFNQWTNLKLLFKTTLKFVSLSVMFAAQISCNQLQMRSEATRASQSVTVPLLFALLISYPEVKMEEKKILNWKIWLFSMLALFYFYICVATLNSVLLIWIRTWVEGCCCPSPSS